MLGALTNPKELHRHYHVPASNTALGHIVLENETMRLLVAGATGAFGRKHMAALDNIDGVEVTSIIGGNAAPTQAMAKELNIPHWGLDLAEGLARDDVDAAILVTPTQQHAAQAIQVLEAGKALFR